ncbi:hypothetical protein ACFY04_15915 [Streptomyces sp. NPDC001549]|uniref:hypothetical protein n=1 Tax=Streptomyces sp. NPDC001549 TaxID=3364586 RepID=UPI0036C6C9CB
MSGLTAVLFAIALVLIAALLVGAGAGKLARLDGATYPTAILHAAAAFTAVVTLAAAVTAALATVLA